MLPSSKELYEENISGTSEARLAKKYKTTRSTIHGIIYRYKKENNLLEENNSITDQITIEEKENETIITSKTQRRIKTLDQLIKECQIDLDKWEVTRWIANKWDMTNAEGRTFENWQVKAWLASKSPIYVFPDLHPVHVEVTAIPQSEKNNKAIKRVMVIADPHFGFDKQRDGSLLPYHNENIIGTAFQIFRDNPFDALIWAGDVLDCNEWSDHWISRPEFTQTTQPALIEASRWMGTFIKEKPEAEYIMLRGNHDDRIEKYIINNLAEAYQLRPGDDPDSEPVMSISNLLGLKRMGIEYLDEHVIGSTKFVHGTVARKGGGATARVTLENTSTNMVFAHVHRRELVTETKIGEYNKRIEVFSMCPGCACYTDGRVPGSEYDHNWQNGIAILEFENSDCLSHQIVKIDNGKASYNGKVY